MGTDVHWLAVLAAAIAGFLVGGIWYGPVFGKAWMAARGLSPEALKSSNMGLIFGLTFVLNLVMAFVLDHVLSEIGRPALAVTLMASGGIALGFIAPAMGVNYLFSRLSFRLFAIDAGYWLVNFVAMGLIFAALA